MHVARYANHFLYFINGRFLVAVIGHRNYRAINYLLSTPLLANFSNGALVAVIGVALPSIIVITVIASLLSEFADIVLVQKVLKGIIIVVVILLGTAIIEIGSKAIRNIYLFLYAVACFAAVYFLGISSVIIIGLSFLLGTIHTLFRKRVKQ